MPTILSRYTTTSINNLISVNLEDQKKAVNKMKDKADKLRVLNSKSSRIQKKRVFNQKKQPWQTGLIKTSNALFMKYDYVKAKYGADSIRTAKLNQVTFTSYP